MKKIISIIIVASFLTVVPVISTAPANAVYAGQFCKERQLGNVVQKLKAKLPKPKYDTLQCQLKGKRYKWIKVNK
jgi:hypothetical protein